jgi:hypothetical protein
LSAKRQLTRHFDQIWGEDRYLNSPYYGQVVNEIIILWQAPGLPVAKENMSGALAHGSYVQVVNKAEMRGKTWYKVLCSVQHDGRNYPQVGWVSERMLLKRGRDAFS